MAYSGDPSASALDAIRFWLQDTSPTTPLLSDEEIRYFITFAGGYSADPVLIAAELCSVIQAKYAGEGRISGDGIDYDSTQLQDKYTQLASTLRATYTRINGNQGLPFAGGLDVACRTYYANTRPPVFALGQNDRPDGPSQLLEEHGLGAEDPYNTYDPGNYQTQ